MLGGTAPSFLVIVLMVLLWTEDSLIVADTQRHQYKKNSLLPCLFC